VAAPLDHLGTVQKRGSCAKTARSHERLAKLRSQPEPRPGPLVVKKGSIASALVSGDVPDPLSDTASITKLPSGDVAER
jgi:hypothetical protein